MVTVIYTIFLFFPVMLYIFLKNIRDIPFFPFFAKSLPGSCKFYCSCYITVNIFNIAAENENIASYQSGGCSRHFVQIFFSQGSECLCDRFFLCNSDGEYRRSVPCRILFYSLQKQIFRFSGIFSHFIHRISGSFHYIQHFCSGKCQIIQTDIYHKPNSCMNFF